MSPNAPPNAPESPATGAPKASPTAPASKHPAEWSMSFFMAVPTVHPVDQKVSGQYSDRGVLRP